MYKIYVNDTLIMLIGSEMLTDVITTYDPELIFSYKGNPTNLLKHVALAEKSEEINNIVIHAPLLKSLKHDFESHFRIIKAAGGIVVNPKGQIMVIFRKGSWDLPKGKLEKKEKKKIGAIREVMEETGIAHVELVSKLMKTYHTYQALKNRVLKKTHWYIMSGDQEVLVPQAEEDIEIVKWVYPEEFLAQNPVIYRNILDIINFYIENKITTL